MLMRQKGGAAATAGRAGGAVLRAPLRAACDTVGKKSRCRRLLDGARAEKRARADRLGDGPEREMLEQVDLMDKRARPGRRA